MEPREWLRDLLSAVQTLDGGDVQSYRLSDDMLHIHIVIGHREFIISVVPTDLGHEGKEA